MLAGPQANIYAISHMNEILLKFGGKDLMGCEGFMPSISMPILLYSVLVVECWTVWTNRLCGDITVCPYNLSR